MQKKTSFAFSFAAVLIFISACSSSPKLPSGVDLKTGTSDGLESVVILGTNDIHGSLTSQDLKSRETPDTHSVAYQAGGLPYLASYIRIAREQFGPRLIWLDAGDEFQGSIESNSEKGAPLVRFFNLLGLNAAAVGNHEFDYGPENDAADKLGALKARMTEAHYPYLTANIMDRATGSRYPFPGSLPHMIITAGALKIGVIGLSTLETPTTTRTDNIRALDFTDLKEATLKESAALRREGANVVLITAHVGLHCDRGKSSVASMIRKPTDHQGTCGEKDEMVKLLENLPTGTVDAVVSGHSHQVVHHWINGVPVIQGGAYGRYFNLIYLTYDWNQKKLLTDRTRIEGPVPICPLVFKTKAIAMEIARLRLRVAGLWSPRNSMASRWKRMPLPPRFSSQPYGKPWC